MVITKCLREGKPRAPGERMREEAIQRLKRRKGKGGRLQRRFFFFFTFYFFLIFCDIIFLEGWGGGKGKREDKTGNVRTKLLQERSSIFRWRTVTRREYLRERGMTQK